MSTHFLDPFVTSKMRLSLGKRCCFLLLVVALSPLVLYRCLHQSTVVKDNRIEVNEWKIAYHEQYPPTDSPLPVEDTGQDSTRMPEQFSTSGPEVLERAVSDEVWTQGVVQPAHPRIVRGHWQMVDYQLEVYLYSAYLDDRMTLNQSFVRIIGVADTTVRNLFCLLWFETGSTPSVAHVDIKSVGPNIRPRVGPEYGQYVFSCRIPTTSGIPRNVSIVTPHVVRPSNVLEIRVPVKPASPSEVVEFGLCMSVVYWYHDPIRVVEWLELHRMWGVGEVNVYAYELDNATLGAIGRYAKTGFVKLHRVSTVHDDDNEFEVIMNMSPVINDCLYRNLYRYRYVVCTDFDEMIVPRGPHRNYFTMLEASMGKISSTRGGIPLPVKSFAYRNVYFFLDFGPVLEEPWYLLTARYQTRISPSRFGYSSKSITRTLDCLGLQNHYCWEPLDGVKTDPGWNVDVEVETGMSHHYKRCHFDRYLGKDGVCLRVMASSFRDPTMEKFKDELAERVSKVLIELDLVETRIILDSPEPSQNKRNLTLNRI